MSHRYHLIFPEYEWEIFKDFCESKNIGPGNETSYGSFIRGIISATIEDDPKVQYRKAFSEATDLAAAMNTPERIAARRAEMEANRPESYQETLDVQG